MGLIRDQNHSAMAPTVGSFVLARYLACPLKEGSANTTVRACPKQVVNLCRDSPRINHSWEFYLVVLMLKIPQVPILSTSGCEGGGI